jgi:hypothetical protein
MSNLESLKIGFRNQKKYKKFVLFFWFVTFILALIPVWTETNALKNFMEQSVMVDLFYQKIFSMTREFSGFNPSLGGVFTSLKVFATFLLILISIGVSGGFMYAFLHQKKSIGKALGVGFSHYKRLAVLALFNFGLIIISLILFYILYKLTLLITGKETEPDYLIAFIVSGIFLFALWLMKDLLYDFMRISYMNNPRNSLHQAVPVAISYVSKNWLQLFVLSLIFQGIMGLIFLVGHLINHLFDHVSGLHVFISFLITQSVIWLRIFWRQWFWQSEIAIFKASDYYVSHPSYVENEL